MFAKHQPVLRVGWVLVAVLALMSACTLTNNQTPNDNTPLTFEGPPVVTLNSPLPNATYLVGTEVNIVARVENAGPQIAAVQIGINNDLIANQDISGQAGAAAFAITQGWQAPSPGQYTIRIIVSRPDGTQSLPATVTINVVSQSMPPAVVTTPPVAVSTAESAPVAQPTTATIVEPPPVQPVFTDIPTLPPQPTFTPAPTLTNTPSVPTGRVTAGANVRNGPGTVFTIVGSASANTSVQLLAVNSDRSWYLITSTISGQGWISASLLDVSGANVDSLRIDNGPPPPPPTNTPAPTSTPAPVATVDLSITQSNTNPFPLVCGQASTVTLNIANTGSQNSPATTVIVEDLYNGQVIASVSADIPSLAPNTGHAVTINITVSTYFSEGHEHRIRVDPNNSVPETNENNNVQAFPYVLAQGNC